MATTSFRDARAPSGGVTPAEAGVNARTLADQAAARDFAAI